MKILCIFIINRNYSVLPGNLSTASGPPPLSGEALSNFGPLSPLKGEMSPQRQRGLSQSESYDWIDTITQENRIKLMLMNARVALGDTKKTEAC